MRAGRIAGVQIVLNNWFLGLLLFFCFAGMGVKVLILFASILWHELAHAVVATLLGYRVREIELLPFGGVARIEHIGEAGAMSEILMAAAGPLASLVLAAVIYFMMIYMPEGELYLPFFFKANIMLALFNLLPGLPLDGGRVLRAFLAMRWDFSRATAAVVNCGKGIAVILILISAVDFWLSRTLNVTFIFAAVFFYACAKTEMSVAGFRTMRLLARKKEELTTCGFMPTVHVTAVGTAPVRDILRFFKPEQYHIILIVDKKFRLQGMLTETEVWEALPSHGLYSEIGEFL